MLEFTTHNYLLFSRKEIWFYNGEAYKKAAYMSFSAAKKTAHGSLKALHLYNSAALDISQTEEALLKGVHPRLRYDLQLAEKKNMQFHVMQTPDDSECAKVMEIFNRFAAQKPIAPMKKEWIKAAVRTGKFFLTKITYNNEDAVFHIFLYNDKEVLNTHSFYNPRFDNPDINKFANKLLHWKEIVYFKNKGFEIYSFGPVNPELKGITQFKMNYGCRLEGNSHFIKASPFLAFLLKWLRRLVKT